MPGSAGQPWEQQLQYATCAPLLGYPDAPAPPAWRLVPEAAAAWPAVSPDGRTYTFKIGPGLRFSPPLGQPVTAATFRYTIERALSPVLGPDAPAVSVASDIVGVSAFRAASSDHISGIRVAGDILTITLLRPAADFPERIAFSYFCPVPVSTPTTPNGLWDPIPSAGPSYLSGNIGDVVAVLRRNPNYHGSRPRRLAAIVYREQPRTGAAVASIEAGNADYVAEQDPALAPGTAVARQFGRTAPPLLRHAAPRHRRAGVRHRALPVRRPADAPGRQLRPRPACPRRGPRRPRHQPLPAARHAGLPRTACLPAQRTRPPAGPRTGRRARRTRRPRRLHRPHCTELGRIIQADLARIGIRIQLRPYAGAIASATTRPGADIVLARVFAPYPDPAAFLKAALRGRFAQDRLATLAGLNRGQRLTAASQLELQLMRGPAPLAAIGTPIIPEFFSARVSCHIFQPVEYGADLASLCVP